ncbi:hypothetical protein lerEdw1_004982 [Lerista edwardsae]|nr:hypothetical protein lerEdw1_004982 [Lerista edwardsae]
MQARSSPGVGGGTAPPPPGTRDMGVVKQTDGAKALHGLGALPQGSSRGGGRCGPRKCRAPRVAIWPEGPGGEVAAAWRGGGATSQARERKVQTVSGRPWEVESSHGGVTAACSVKWYSPAHHLKHPCLSLLWCLYQTGGGKVGFAASVSRTEEIPGRCPCTTAL